MIIIFLKYRPLVHLSLPDTSSESNIFGQGKELTLILGWKRLAMMLTMLQH
jgi:hypothetical protein